MYFFIVKYYLGLFVVVVVVVCRVDEAHTRRMKNGKVAAFCTLAV